MIFDILYASVIKGELLLIDGGMCRWHLRKDGQLTIYEIIATCKGSGTEMLDYLKTVPNASSIFAKCPEHLTANIWYAKRGFVCVGEEFTKSGERILLWELLLHGGID